MRVWLFLWWVSPRDLGSHPGCQGTTNKLFMENSTCILLQKTQPFLGSYVVKVGPLVQLHLIFQEKRTHWVQSYLLGRPGKSDRYRLMPSRRIKTLCWIFMDCVSRSCTHCQMGRWHTKKGDNLPTIDTGKGGVEWDHPQNPSPLVHCRVSSRDTWVTVYRAFLLVISNSDFSLIQTLTPHEFHFTAFVIC